MENHFGRIDACSEGSPSDRLLSRVLGHIAQRTEQADALQEWQYLRDECARLADLTYGNPPLHERLDFMSWGSSVEETR